MLTFFKLSVFTLFTTAAGSNSTRQLSGPEPNSACSSYTADACCRNSIIISQVFFHVGVSYTFLGIHECTWCASDNQCHDIGSLYDPCSNDCCASKGISTCDHSTPSSIPTYCPCTITPGGNPPCAPNGYCSGYSTCTCNKGWSNPPACNIPLCDPICVHGKCVGPNSCQCDPNWIGANCNTTIGSGAQLVTTQKFLDFVSATLLEVGLDVLNNLNIPDQNGDQDDFTWSSNSLITLIT
jgi:hypothetical protein